MAMPNAVIAPSTCSMLRFFQKELSFADVGVEHAVADERGIADENTAFPSRLASSIDVAMIDGDVRLPRTISSSFITLAGLKK